VIAFTFFDPLFNPAEAPGFDLRVARHDAHPGPNILHRLDVKGEEFAGVDQTRALQAARTARWLTLAGGTLLVEPDSGPLLEQLPEWSSYIQYYNPDYLRSLFDGAEVLVPMSPERQHCCVIRG